MTKKWFESWFDSPYYHILYRDRDISEATNFINKLIDFLKPAKGAKVMDLACGKGRHAFQLAKKGYQVTGLDLSPESIIAAKKACLPNLQCAVHDMRRPFKKNHFDYVFSFFTSFGYFNDQEEDLNVLKAVHTNLKSDGIYVLDFLNEQQVLKTLIPYQEKKIDGITFKISKEVIEGFVFKKIDFEADKNHYSFTERVRLIKHKEMNTLFEQSNLKIIHTFGNYNLDYFDKKNSPRLIIIAQKKIK